MKNIITKINEAAKKSTKYTLKDLQEGIYYLQEYYQDYPEEKGEFPNWGELEDVFSNEKFQNALMDGDKDPLVIMLDDIAALFFVNK